jgi:Flp pilus assembly protein TadD
LDAAEALYRNVLTREPDNADALHLLGMLLNQRGHQGQALELIRRAITHKPRAGEFHNSLGTVLGAHGQPLDAEAAFRQAIALKSNYAEAHRNLGLSLRRQERWEEAAVAFRTATQLRPEYGEALANLAGAARQLGDATEAADAEQAALAIQGGPPEAHNTLGLDLRALRRLDEAIEQLRRAVRLSPSDPFLHFNLALVLLEAGQYEEGFREYEWRWRLPEFLKRQRNFSQPRWDGSELKGRTILLYTEQGLGTNIQFIRYATLVAQRGGRVIVQCPPTLARLFATVAGVSEVIAGSSDAPLPTFDTHAPLASLPHLMGTTLETIPNTVPYVKADSLVVESWRRRISPDGNGLKVGLVWAGNQKPDPARTCPLAEFAPLARLEGVRFYSLQKGPFAADAARPPAGLRLTDLSPDLTDFAETAAAVTALDQVISVDTSVAHLTGALGRPVCTLLPYLADWRWLVCRANSPWYKTMQLLRQDQSEGWPLAIDKLKGFLNRANAE